MVGLQPFHTVGSIPHIPVGQVQQARRELALLAGIQIPWMDFGLPSMALDTRFPAGMTNIIK